MNEVEVYWTHEEGTLHPYRCWVRGPGFEILLFRDTDRDEFFRRYNELKLVKEED